MTNLLMLTREKDKLLAFSRNMEKKIRKKTTRTGRITQSSTKLDGERCGSLGLKDRSQ